MREIEGTGLAPAAVWTVSAFVQDPSTASQLSTVAGFPSSQLHAKQAEDPLFGW